jgi:sulfate transport system ATP-binding protein
MPSVRREVRRDGVWRYLPEQRASRFKCTAHFLKPRGELYRPTVAAGGVALAGVVIPAPGCVNGPADLLFRPNDVIWSGDDRSGLPVAIARVFDRPDSRRLLATTDDGGTLEIDVPADTAVSGGSKGYLHKARPRFRVGRCSGPHA